MGSDWFKKTFDVNDGQLRFLMVLSFTALVLCCYLVISSYAIPQASSPELPLLLGDGDRQFTGLFMVDPNSSPADSLELLPGIGSVKANRIVAYRQHHRFEKVVDITEVDGIGPKLFEKIRPYLKIRR